MSLYSDVNFKFLPRPLRFYPNISWIRFDKLSPGLRCALPLHCEVDCIGQRFFHFRTRDHNVWSCELPYDSKNNLKDVVKANQEWLIIFFGNSSSESLHPRQFNSLACLPIYNVSQRKIFMDMSELETEIEKHVTLEEIEGHLVPL